MGQGWLGAQTVREEWVMRLGQVRGNIGIRQEIGQRAEGGGQVSTLKARIGNSVVEGGNTERHRRHSRTQ